MDFLVFEIHRLCALPDQVDHDIAAADSPLDRSIITDIKLGQKYNLQQGPNASAS